MATPPPFPQVLPLAEACRAAGGRALVVGGAVRDLVLVREGAQPPGFRAGAPKDLDVEVHGLSTRVLERLLARLGNVDLVGRAFAVYKLTLGDDTLDVSLPRRDSRLRPGHRGIRAVGDPAMGLREAARRRDLTINAMALDPLTGQVEDPWGGIADLRLRLLRAVDPATFVEDPLRALRVPQFAARFRFTVDEGLLGLCAGMPLHELPSERVRGELQKLLLLSQEPSLGLGPALCAAVWRRVHPALVAVDSDSARAAVDRAAALRDARWPGTGPRAEALLLAALLHGVPAPDREPLLDRLGVHTQDRFPLRLAVLACLARQGGLPTSCSDGDLRLLAREAEPAGGLGLWFAVAAAARADPALEDRLARVEALGVARGVPGPLVGGRDLLARGMSPGPAIGELLERLYLRQLREDIREPGPLLAEVDTERGHGR